jgi:endosialidase-like protein
MHVRSRVLLSLSLLLLIVPITAFAAADGQPVGRMTANAAGLAFQIGSDNESVTLTISGPNNFQYSHQFASARSISLRLRDIGATMPDGSYTYEMRLAPRVSDSVRAQIAVAREAGDDAALDRIRAEAGLKELPSQSGTFTIMNGSLIASDATEPSNPSEPKDKVGLSNGTVSSQSLHNAPVKALDVVTADDEIIQGSLCVGLDCVNNESFGFDTIRLKENNTRIKFDDTSSSTGFPNHDWQLTANDSASGGANKFSIEDITASTVPMTITGSAPTNSIFVDSTGRVGFRTSTPVLDLHVATSNTPAMRLEQNNSGGFTAQTWDVAGNEANFFVRDVTGGSRLPFRIRPGAPTSSIDINASGQVGVGTASPTTQLDVVGTIRARVNNAFGLQFNKADGTAGDVAALDINNTLILKGLGGGLVVRDATNTNTRMAVLDTGNVGIGTSAPGSQLVIANGGTTSSINAGSAQFTVASSRTFKENIEPVEVPDILTKIEAIPVVTYDFRNNGPKDRLGLIAEDFHTVFGRGDDKHIDGQDVQMALWIAVQKLTAENKALTDRLSKLEGELAQKPKP